MIKKVYSRIKLKLVRFMNFFDVKKYMKSYNKWLRNEGLRIPEYDGVGYIDPSAYLDGSDFSRIKIGKGVTISKEVMILTHDFSIWNGMIVNDKNNKAKRYEFKKSVEIGDNCFIGARAFILPGTTIGNNVIIGAGSVVKGIIPDNTVWAGNPAKQISTIEQFTERHLEKRDFEEV